MHASDQRALSQVLTHWKQDPAWALGNCLGPTSRDPDHPGGSGRSLPLWLAVCDHVAPRHDEDLRSRALRVAVLEGIKEMPAGETWHRARRLACLAWDAKPASPLPSPRLANIPDVQRLEDALALEQVRARYAVPALLRQTPDAMCTVLLVRSSAEQASSRGRQALLTLWRVDAQDQPGARAQLVRAPGACLLDLNTAFMDGLAQAQAVVNACVAPEQAPAIAWALRPLPGPNDADTTPTDHGAGPWVLQAVDGESMTAALLAGALKLLAQHLDPALPQRTQVAEQLRDLDLGRVAISACLDSSSPPDPAQPLALRLATVRHLDDKLNDFEHPRLNNVRPPERAMVAHGQDLPGNRFAVKECASVAELLTALHRHTAEPLSEDAWQLYWYLVTTDPDQPLSDEIRPCLNRVRRQRSPQQPDSGLKAYLLFRYAWWAGGEHRLFGGPGELPRLADDFQPILLDLVPSDAEHARYAKPEDLRKRSLAELFRDYPDEAGWQLDAPPGAGKSTLTAQFEMAAARSALTRHHACGDYGEVAVWLPMRDYRAADGEDPAAALDRMLGRHAAALGGLGTMLNGRWGPGTRFRLLLDALNETPGDLDSRATRVQALSRWLTDPPHPVFLPPLFTVRTLERGFALQGIRQGRLRAWNEAQRNHYIAQRLGPWPERAHTLREFIAKQDRVADDEGKLFANPGLLAIQCTLLASGLVTEPAANRAQLFSCLLWLHLHRERTAPSPLPVHLLGRSERRFLESLEAGLKRGDWRLPDAPGELLAQLARQARHMQSSNRLADGSANPQLSLPRAQFWPEAPRREDWLDAAERLHLTESWDDDQLNEHVRWVHQLWLEFFAAYHLRPDGELPDLRPPPLVPPTDQLEAFLLQDRDNVVPKAGISPEEEVVQFAVQIRPDAVRWVERLMKDNLALAARVVLANRHAFGEPEGLLGPWQPGQAHPLLTRLRRRLLLRSVRRRVDVRHRIEAATLLGELGGDERFELSADGRALLLKDRWWAQIGPPGGQVAVEMGELGADSYALTEDGQLLTVSLDSFEVAGLCVTNAQYLAFVQDADFGQSPHLWPGVAGEWRSRARPADRVPWSLRDRRPLVEPVQCNLWQAWAYARWEDERRYTGAPVRPPMLRLPSEAQWEAAARSATPAAERWQWPHGPRPPGPLTFNHGKRFGFTPVGVFPEGWVVPRGRVATPSRCSHPAPLADLSGNTWEWTGSRWTPKLQHGEVMVSAIPIDKPFRCALRGGSFGSPAAPAASAFRFHDLPVFDFHDVGFRLVRCESPIQNPEPC